MEIRGWFHLKFRTIRKAIEALLMAGDREHEEARRTQGEESRSHRESAEEFHAAKQDLWAAEHGIERPSMKNCSDDSVHGNSAPVQSVRNAPHTQTVNISDRAVSIVAFGLAVAAFVVSIWAYKQSADTNDRAITNLRQVQVQLMYANAIMLREGIVQPGDMVYGPEGNLEYKQHELKRKEK
jgi:hypothetical protein